MSTASLTIVVVAAGLVTFASRAAFLVGAARHLPPVVDRFLDAFPLALFVALAVVQAIAPDGEPVLGPSLVALAVGALVAWRTPRLVLIMAAGWASALVVAAL